MQTRHEIVIIGADSAGLALAALFANVDSKVLLLDNQAERLMEGMPKLKAQLYLPEFIERVEAASISTILQSQSNPQCAFLSGDCAREDLAAQALEHFAPDTPLILLNTNLAPQTIGEQITAEHKQRLYVGGLANPIGERRYLEYCPHSEVPKEKKEALAHFLQQIAGLLLVECPYSPGLCIERLAIQLSLLSIHLAEKLYLTIEQVDAILSFLGFRDFSPFRFIDQIGMPQVSGFLEAFGSSSSALLQNTFPITAKSVLKQIDPASSSINAGKTFYRGEGNDTLVLDLTTLAYRQPQNHELANIDSLSAKPLRDRLVEAMQLKDQLGEFARLLLPALNQIIMDISKSTGSDLYQLDHNVQRALKWEIQPSDVHQLAHPAQSAQSASNRDDYRKILVDQPGYHVSQQDGTALLITLKTPRLNREAIKSLTDYLDEHTLQPIILYSDQDDFGVGFNLSELLESVTDTDKDARERFMIDLQGLSNAIAKHPSVAIIKGRSLGYHHELAIACDVIVSLADCKMGMDHAAFGLIPCGGGATRLCLSNQPEGAKKLSEIAFAAGTARIANNAFEALKLGLLRTSDRIIHDPDLLLSTAQGIIKDGPIKTNSQWKESEGPLRGMIDRHQLTMKAKNFSSHDELISDKIKGVFVRAKSFEEALAFERSACLELCEKALTLARIRHMIATGKSLRN